MQLAAKFLAGSAQQQIFKLDSNHYLDEFLQI